MSRTSPPSSLSNAAPSRRDRLNAYLRAVIFNSDIDPELLDLRRGLQGIENLMTTQPPYQTQAQLQTKSATTALEPRLFAEEPLPLSLDSASSVNSVSTDIFNANPCFDWQRVSRDPSSNNYNDYLFMPRLSSDGNVGPESSNCYLPLPLQPSSNWDPLFNYSNALGTDDKISTISPPSLGVTGGSSTNNTFEEQRGVESKEVGNDRGEDTTDDDAGSVRSTRTQTVGGKTTQSKRAVPSGMDSHRGNSSSGSHRPQKTQRTHYVVEKRYRTGLNERFEALRECVESWKRSQQLQSRIPTSGTSPSQLATRSGEEGDVNGVAKMNKAEVLVEAVEYFKKLQEENDVMVEHLESLVRRMRAAQLVLQHDESVNRSDCQS